MGDNMYSKSSPKFRGEKKSPKSLSTHHDMSAAMDKLFLGSFFLMSDPFLTRLRGHGSHMFCHIIRGFSSIFVDLK